VKGISAYERVLMANPNNIEAVTVLAKYYQKNHMNYDLEDLKHTIENSRLTPEQRQIVSTLLEGEKSLVSTRFSATFNIGYDNNLNFGIDKRGIDTGKNDISSAFNSFGFRGNYVNELEEAGGFSVQSNVDFYWQGNYSAHYYDTIYGSIDAGVGYTTSNMLFYVPFVYRRMNYLDTDLYEQYGIAPRMTISIGNDRLVNIDMKYLRQKYIDRSYRDSDNTLLNGSIGIYQFYGQNYIYVSAKYNRFNAINEIHAPFTEYNYLQLFAGASYEIEDLVIVGIDYQYGYGDYDDLISKIDMKKRKDDFNQIHLSIQKDLTTAWKIVADYIYANNDSNYEAASYNKQTVTIGMQYNY